MELSLRRPGVLALMGMVSCGLAQAGMELKAVPAATVTAPVPMPAGKPSPAVPRSRSPSTTAAPRQEDKAAWPTCIRQLNAAALGAELDADRRQALLEQCGS